jgi:outer membrane protein assembly factor BamB
MPQFALTAIQTIVENQSAVVPVVAQAGTALAPLLALAVSSTIGLLMRPRELFKLLKAKPWILLVMAALIGGIWWLSAWLLAPPVVTDASSARSAGSASFAEGDVAGGTDWAAVALTIIRQREAAAQKPETRTAVAPSAVAPAPAPAPGAVPLGSTISAPADAGRPLYFRGDVRRSGHLGGAAPLGLKPAWSYYARDERNAMVLSSPIVRDGMVYSASCLLYPPKSFGTVSCVELATGKERWCTNLMSANPKQDFIGFFSSPALTADGSRLLIGQGLHLDYDSDLVCLDARTGAVIWTVHTPLHIECSPAIEGDIVVVGAGSVEVGDDHKPVGDPQGRGNPGFVLGVRISTGEVLFRHPVNDPEGSPVLELSLIHI